MLVSLKSPLIKRPHCLKKKKNRWISFPVLFAGFLVPSDRSPSQSYHIFFRQPTRIISFIGCITVALPSWCLVSPAYRLFVHPVLKLKTKKRNVSLLLAWKPVEQTVDVLVILNTTLLTLWCLTDGFHSQRASNAENVSMSRPYHVVHQLNDSFEMLGYKKW